MKVAVAVLLVLAVGARAQLPFYNNWAYSGYPYGYTGYPYGYYGYSPVAAAEVKTAAAVATAPITSAAFAYSGFPYTYAPAVTANQYHSQDELGQASFGYSHPGQAAVNYRDAAGNQVGSWAYFSPEGKEVRVSYVADSNGFRVLSNALPEGPAALAAALPEPVQDTPEVAAAKAAHMAAHEAAKANDGALPEVVYQTNDLVAPTPVQDTAEVAAAKAEHQAAWQAALAAAQASGEGSESRKKRSVFFGGYTGLPLMPWGLRSAAVVAPAFPTTNVREAVLSKTVHNPGHAVSYRVD